jgi:hypothetical protein
MQSYHNVLPNCDNSAAWVAVKARNPRTVLGLTEAFRLEKL